MLIKLTIENVLSYDAPATFSLVAGKITKQHKEQVTDVGGVSVLRGAIVYGPNAAGKSNLLRAVFVLVQMLNGDSCRYSYGGQFKLTNEPRNDMSWDMLFSAGGHVYRYLVKTDGVSISEECLWLVSDKEEVVFERSGLNVSFGQMFADRTWYESRSFEKSRFVICTLKRDGIIDRRESIPNSEVIIQAIEGLQQIIVLSSDSIPEAQYIGSLLKVEEFMEFLKRLMTVADIGITDVQWRACSRDQAMLILDRHRSVNPIRQDGVQFAKDGQALWAIVTKDGASDVFELKFIHNGFELSLNDESVGTIRLFNLSVFLFNLKRTPSVWFVDEIDCHLHPNIAYRLLKEFMTMPNVVSQLVVTAHDTSLMTHDIWRTDEVWFAEKRMDGSSDLYSLYQFTPRFDKRLEKGYRQGLYGAMPHIGGEMLNG